MLDVILSKWMDKLDAHRGSLTEAQTLAGGHVALAFMLYVGVGCACIALLVLELGWGKLLRPLIYDKGSSMKRGNFTLNTLYSAYENI